MGKKKGVIPCYEGLIKVGATKETATIIKSMESISLSIDNTVEEWDTYDSEGWKNRLLTAKSITVSCKGKRNIGDAGNDYVAGKAEKMGLDAYGYFAIIFPSERTFEWDEMLYEVTTLEVADATNASPLEFDAKSNGKPNITEAQAA